MPPSALPKAVLFEGRIVSIVVMYNIVLVEKKKKRTSL